MQMSERPILFSGAMVRAILAGRKSQTRRVVKHDVSADCVSWKVLDDGRWTQMFQYGKILASKAWAHSCPYGIPGDRLWVRETRWQIPEPSLRQLRDGADTWPKVAYNADETEISQGQNREMGWKLRPSIFMPRWASRITLEITDVRVQRVQEITEEDARAEGIQIPVEKIQDPPAIGLLRITGKHAPIRYFPPGFLGQEHTIEERTTVWLRAHYASLWDDLNESRGFGWDSNPWVWCLTFKRIAAEVSR